MSKFKKEIMAKLFQMLKKQNTQYIISLTINIYNMRIKNPDIGLVI